jgi:hypothetical protein
MTTEEIAKTVFHPKLHQKLQEKIKEIDGDEKQASSSKSSLQE